MKKYILKLIVIVLLLNGCGLQIQSNTESDFYGDIEKSTSVMVVEKSEAEIRLSFIAEELLIEKNNKSSEKAGFLISKDKLLQGDLLSVHVSGTDESMKTFLEIPGMDIKKEIANTSENELILIPIAYYTKPDIYFLKVKMIRDETIVFEAQKEIHIIEKDFEVHHMRVPEKLKSVRSTENLNNDGQYVRKAKSISSPEKLWEGTFIIPLDDKLFDGFGVKRYINGKFHNIHTGIDIGGTEGDNIVASNNGIVNLAMKLHVTGNTIILDHGKSLYTGYSHLSKILVKEGDEVKKGDVIGLVGSTGFSTGPHLHWTAAVGSTYIEPLFILNDENMLQIEAMINK
jgi:murein DD-endopeptidase MepM/ murein hydrolase activator NlpD